MAEDINERVVRLETHMEYNNKLTAEIHEALTKNGLISRLVKVETSNKFLTWGFRLIIGCAVMGFLYFLRTLASAGG